MRKILVPIVASLFGVLMSGGRAHAQVSVDVPANPPSPATGSYHVVLTNLGGGNWQVTAVGNNDGNPPASANPKSFARNISLTFHNAVGAIVGVVTPGLFSGSTTSGSDASGSYTGNTWFTPSGSNYNASSQGDQYSLAPYGGNTFTGAFSLAGAPLTVDIGLQDHTQQWFVSSVTLQSVVPEPGSLAMLLPGALPLGLALFGRRFRRREEDDEEDPQLPA
jgi:hypothetical protein